MPSSRGGATRQRRSTAQSPQKPHAASEGQTSTRRSTRSGSRDVEPRNRPQQSQDLDPVLEERASEDAELQDSFPDPSQGTDLSVESHSELQNLDAELIIEGLPALYADSLKVLKLFVELDETELYQASEDAHDESTSISRRLHYNVNRLMASSQAFGTVQVFINPDLIAQKLQGDNEASEEGRWRPDAVLYLANIAVLIAAVVGGQKMQVDECLEQTFSSFPAPFASPLPGNRFTTPSARQTVELGNSMRTQLFIRHARTRLNQPDFDPDEALKEVFYNSDNKLNGLDFAGTGTSLYTSQIEKHLRQIRTFFSNDIDAPVRLEALEARYPWPTFMYQVQQWAEARRGELIDSVNGQGGVDDIVDHLEQGDLVSDYPQDTSIAPPATQQTPDKQQVTSFKTNLARKKMLDARRRARQNAEDQDTQSQPPEGEIAESVVGEAVGAFDPGIPMDDEDIASVLTSQLETDRALSQRQQVMARMAVQVQEANQMNSRSNIPSRFIDRQDGAQRLQFDDLTQPPEANGKRRAATESEDGDFQTDGRAHAKRARTIDINIDPQLRGDQSSAFDIEELVPSQPTLPPPTQPRARTIGQRSTGVAAAQPVPPSSAPVPQSPLESPGLGPSTAPARTEAQTGDEPARPAALYRQAQEKAKAKTRQHKNMVPTQESPGSPGGSQSAPPPASQVVAYQERKAWTDDEYDRLVDLIGAHGPAYSKILKDDANMDPPLLQHRSQVQLKDKARNIKVTFIKSGYALLPGFGAVSIGKKMVEKLLQQGIPVEVSFDPRVLYSANISRATEGIKVTDITIWCWVG